MYFPLPMPANNFAGFIFCKSRLDKEVTVLYSTVQYSTVQYNHYTVLVKPEMLVKSKKCSDS